MYEMEKTCLKPPTSNEIIWNIFRDIMDLEPTLYGFLYLKRRYGPQNQIILKDLKDSNMLRLADFLQLQLHFFWCVCNGRIPNFDGLSLSSLPQIATLTVYTIFGQSHMGDHGCIHNHDGNIMGASWGHSVVGKIAYLIGI